MTVTPLSQLGGADAPLLPNSAAAGSPPDATGSASFGAALANAFETASGALAQADRSERAYAHGTGALQAMVLDRAQADIALTIATTAASRTSQALSTILGMQV